MKWSCNRKLREQRTIARRKDKISRLENWHEWFAWTPVIVDDKWVWLEPVLRRFNVWRKSYQCSDGSFHPYSDWSFWVGSV